MTMAKDKKQSLAGKPLVDASYRLLWQDKEMIPLLFLGSVAASIAFLLVSGAGALLVPDVFADDSLSFSGYVVFGVALLASTCISIFFLGAIVAAATMRADGLDPTPRSAMAASWERRGPLFAWAVTSTIVGLVLRRLEDFGPLGWLARLIGGVAWSIGSVFAVQVIMAEGVMPFTAVKRSGQILTARFGSNVRAGFRLGVQWFVATFAAVIVMIVGVSLAFSGATDSNPLTLVLGSLLALGGLIGLFVAIAIYAAVGAYLRTVLYRYAMDLPTPGIVAGDLPPIRPAAAH
jgi:hypothetical protein